ncbi:hypothetical protein CY0110_19357 [Crocosphaera chwakensis CCY0110]|uniref:Uncharacterized protein n=1 Tax=Crocosphaera chwakensis CCY0110 TaxID=391612 RepID=A3IJK3_9CHRO|nr:hypothetical protein CY0110_19357 [Crocosphaera chwakensis CCY0110]
MHQIPFASYVKKTFYQRSTI